MSEVAFQYKSVKRESEGLYKEKGSKFNAYLQHVSSLEEVEAYLEKISILHPKSRHVCYAYRLGIDGEPYRYNDDGEPSGTAGRPIYNELLSNQVSDVICAVVRYFGGTKLGVPGLIKAYKESTKDAFGANEIFTITIKKTVIITYKIEDMGKVYELLKSRGYTVIESTYDPSPSIVIQVPLNEVSTIRAQILADYYGYKLEDINDDFASDRIDIKVV